MHGRVVEFHTLPDSNRTGTEHDDLGFVGDDGFVFASYTNTLAGTVILYGFRL